MDLLDPVLQSAEDEEYELSLRPKGFGDFIGRNKEKDTLQLVISAAKKRNEPIDHILLHGPPGLGKTSLAHVIANEMGANFISTSGPALDRKGDLASILSSIEDNGVLFIDEIHRLSRTLEEMLYTAMEDRAIDIIVGKGPSARTLKLQLNSFTIIAATTRISMLSSPLRDRFGLDLHLDYYEIEDLVELIKQKSALLGIKIEPAAADEIARRARRTPRIAIRILKRVRDLAQIDDKDTVDQNTVQNALTMINIDKFGLDRLDRKILAVMANNFKGGPVGIKTLAASVGEDLDTIESVYEPYLLQEGFLVRSARGRILTEKAINYITGI